jgi:hypothetical protein
LRPPIERLQLPNRSSLYLAYWTGEEVEIDDKIFLATDLSRNDATTTAGIPKARLTALRSPVRFASRIPQALSTLQLFV